jgi:hypothetical protein
MGFIVNPITVPAFYLTAHPDPDPGNQTKCGSMLIGSGYWSDIAVTNSYNFT